MRERYYGFEFDNSDSDYGYLEWLRGEVEKERERYEIAVSAMNEEAQVADAQIASLIRALESWCADMDACETALSVAQQGLAFAEDALYALEQGDPERAECFLDAQADVHVDWYDFDDFSDIEDEDDFGGHYNDEED
jgi:hypothetical protein